jgi:hypothetical protein
MKVKFSILHKIGIVIVGIIFITYFVPYIIEKLVEYRQEKEEKDKKYIESKYESTVQENFVEGLSLDDFNNALDPKKNGIADGFNKVGDDLKKGFDEAANMFKKIDRVFKGIPDLIEGIKNHVQCGSVMTNDGFDNGVKLLGILTKCAFGKTRQFLDGSCTRFYLADMIWGLIYGVFIELPLVILRAIFGVDFQFIIDLIHGVIIVPIDGIIFAMSGYHITKWSDAVISECYRCKGKLSSRGVEFEDEKTFDEWAEMFKCTDGLIRKGFYKIFTAIIPSQKWGAWFNGDNKGGDDDNPEW